MMVTEKIAVARHGDYEETRSKGTRLSTLGEGQAHIIAAVLRNFFYRSLEDPGRIAVLTSIAGRAKEFGQIIAADLDLGPVFATDVLGDEKAREYKMEYMRRKLSGFFDGQNGLIIVTHKGTAARLIGEFVGVEWDLNEGSAIAIDRALNTARVVLPTGNYSYNLSMRQERRRHTWR